MSQAEDFHDDSLPSKPGMSTTTKVVLIMLAVGGSGIFLCCGGMMVGGLYFARSLSQSMTIDPIAVQQATDDIVSIDIPEEFEPTQAMRVDMLKMRMAVYTHKDAPDSVILIMRNDLIADVNDERQRKAMFDQMRQSAGVSAGSEGMQTSETREIEIDGRKTSFQFTTLKQNGKSVRQVLGFVPLKSGGVFIMIIVPEEQYDEDAIIAMLESIREPDDLDDFEMPSAEADENPEHVERFHAPDGESVRLPEAAAVLSEPMTDENTLPERPEAVPLPN